MAKIPKDMIYTPGGPRTPDHVHTVGPDEFVAADAAGKYSVAHKLRPDVARTRQLLSTGLYAITPGGIRPKSMIHVVQPDEVVRPDGTRLKRFNLKTETFVEPPGADFEPPMLPGLGGGWITYGFYVEPAANVVRSMTTTWTVPPEPSREDGQLIYLFNGLQDSPVTQILQPVLQWGKSRAGGGNSWALASWLVTGSGDAFRTQITEVQPGTVLTGLMRMVSLHATWSFWVCEFVGFSDTRLTVNVTGQLVMPVVTLEAYTVQECRDYPATSMTSMRAIGVNTAAGALATGFEAVDSVKKLKNDFRLLILI